jgi:hypothetical protein
MCAILFVTKVFPLERLHCAAPGCVYTKESIITMKIQNQAFQSNTEILPTTPLSLVLRKEYVTVHRETLSQDITFKTGGREESVLLYSTL